jgi:uroporphyrinogen III methyltransferase/synthase
VRVALTRAAGGNDELAARLADHGFETVECPLVAVEPLGGPGVAPGEYDWVVLTSRHGVAALFARIEGRLPRVAAIGPGTADALRAHGVEPDLVPEVSTQEGLVAAFSSDPGRVLFAGAEGARDVLTRELRADFLPLYRTTELAPDFPDADLVVLASASAARALAALGRDLPVVSIGPVTSAEARGVGLRVVAEATTHDLDGLVEAARLAASRTQSSPS